MRESKRPPLNFLLKPIFSVLFIVLLIISIFSAQIFAPFLSKVFAASSPWTQTNWVGGSGQASWSDTTKFSSSSTITNSVANQLTITNNWYNASWGYRKMITIDHTKVTGNLTDYPLLVNLTTDAGLHSNARSDGNDILFTSSDGTTLLKFEIEKYAAVMVGLQAWVKIASLSATTDTVLYMYYGNSGQSSSLQDKANTWDSNFVTVYHLGETSGQHNNSTGVSGLNSSTVSVTQQGANIGKVDGADQFDGTNNGKVLVNNNSNLNPPNDMTVETWIKPALLASDLGRNEVFIQKDNSVDPWKSYSFEYDNPYNNICFNWYNTTSSLFARCSNAVSANAWSYVAGVKNGTNLQTYINGAEDSAYLSGAPSGTLLNSNGSFDIGYTNNYAFDGIVDEVRLSKVARSAQYFSTTYANLNAPTTFVSLAAQETPTLTTGTLTSSIFDTENASDWGTLTYTATTPTNTTATVKVRTGNSPTLLDATAFASCTAVTSGSDISSNSCVTDKQRYVQYQVILTTTDVSATPTFTNFSLAFAASGVPASTGFIQKLGSNLYLNSQIFRFFGTNIYWLGYDESKFNVYGTDDYPTTFMVDDVLNTAQELGVTVVRSQSSISVGCAKCIEPSLGVFNDDGFQMLDYSISVAKTKGIRFIYPLAEQNEGYYHGSKKTFTDWRSVTPSSDFYTNATVIADFKDYINHFLNHVNPYTGVAYKNDPTIMAWETGNELVPPSAWTQTIADYIKSIDSNHLVMDGGSYVIDSNSLGISSVDLYTRHFYPSSNSQLITDANLVQQNNKAFIVGEYDWTGANGGDSLTSFLSSVESNYVSGDIIWSLFGHKNTYGFTQHDDASPISYTLHYPGDTTDIKSRAQQLRNHAYFMQGISVPSHGTVGSPYLHNVTPVSNGYRLIWRGTANANSYTVERSTDNGNTWSVIQTGLTDNDTPWTDTTATPGNAYSYRIKALDLNGDAGFYSNTQTAPGNQIQNGSFDYSDNYNGLSFWNSNNQGSVASTVTHDNTTHEDGSYSAKVNVTTVDGTAWHVQLNQTNIVLRSGKNYTISFWAKANSSKNISVSISQANSPWTDYVDSPQSLTTSWQKFTFTYTAVADEANANLLFTLGAATGQYWIDNVAMTDSQQPPSAPTSLIQTKSDGTTTIATGDWTNENTVIAKFSMSSALNTDSLTPQVEVQEVGTSFTNIPTSTGSAVAYLGSSVTGVISITGLTNTRQYHWQARVINSVGTSFWVSNGGNPDFKVDTSLPSTPGIPSTTTLTNSTTQTWIWTVATDAISGIINYAWRVVDPSNNPIISGTTSGLSVVTNLTQGIYNFFIKALSGAGTYGSESQGSLTVNTTAPSASNNSSAPTGCSNQAPSSSPDLFQIDTINTKATVYFAPSGMPYDNYVIRFGLTANNLLYSASFTRGYAGGVIYYTINELNPNTIYYFQVRAGNGCKPGDWGNTLSAKTTGSIKSTSKSYESLGGFIKSLLSSFSPKYTGPAIKTPTPTTVINGTPGQCTQYTVLRGDSFWTIAQKLLGSGQRYLEIWKANISNFPTLKNSPVIRAGWKLSVGC